MNNLAPDELLSRCVMIDNGVPGDVIEPEGWMFGPDLVRDRHGERYETSVILHADQTDEELDSAGKYIEEVRKKHPRYLGRCVCSVGDVEAVGALNVELHSSRINAQHANILGWSNDWSRQMLETERLAEASTYVPRVS